MAGKSSDCEFSSDQSATYSAAVKVVKDKESSESVTTVNDLLSVHIGHSDHHVRYIFYGQDGWLFLISILDFSGF